MRSVSILSPNTQALPESLKLDQSTLVFFPLRPNNRTSDRTTISPETRIASQDIPPKYVPGQLVTSGGGTQKVVSNFTKPSPKAVQSLEECLSKSSRTRSFIALPLEILSRVGDCSFER